MPFTPFHFGPGMLVKSVAPRWFSMTAFAASQVVIDLESLYYLLRHEYPVHRGLHTFVGATLAGAAACGAVWLVKHVALRTPLRSVRPTSALAALLKGEFTTRGILVGGILGAWSHVLLDAIMHHDARPFGPWSDANPFLRVIEVGPLHVACMVSGILGFVIYLWWLTGQPPEREFAR